MLKTDKIDARRKQHKKGLEADEARRKREDVSIKLRKDRRDEQIQKRRMGVDKQSHAVEYDEEDTQYDEQTKQSLQALLYYVELIQQPDPQGQLSAARYFRELLSIERNPPIQEVINAGVVPILVSLLSVEQQTPTLQFEAAWALTNIASGTSSHTHAVVECGGVPVFVNLLRSSSVDVREQAVWALGNIAGDSPHCRDFVLQCGCLPPLLQLLTPNSQVTMLRNATWTLSNLCRGKPQPDFAAVSPALPTLGNLIFNSDEEVLTDACWALSYLSDDSGPNNEKIQAVIQSGCVRRLVELLMHKSNNVKTPALRTVGNIVTGDDLQTQVVLHCGVLQQILHLLSNAKRNIRKEACWTISNITAGNAVQVQEVIQANLIPPLIALLRQGEADVRKEAAWALSNATSSGTDEQLEYLVDQGCIPPLCDLFRFPEPKVVSVALEGIENILKAGRRIQKKNGLSTNRFAEAVELCHGMDYMESLQEIDEDEVADKAAELLREYFGGEVVDTSAAELAPQTDAQGYAFGAQQTNGKFSF